jgi:LPXTG-motif cell wall-anchored protein
MRNLHLLAVILAVLACLAAAQTSMPQPAPALRILTPHSGESLADTFVTVKYELAAPASAASTPTFQLQLDSRSAVQTTDTQYTFTGVPPGAHTITVQVVDANNIPIPGVQNQVQFTVQPQNRSMPATPGAPGRQETMRARLEPAAMTSRPQPSSSQAAGSPQAPPAGLPNTGSPLPLLSVIGMGVLVGGIASALRTRRRSKRAQ